MKTVSSVRAVRLRLETARQRGKSIGFVPTMGALHRGHRALIERARAECDVVVVSIFVNPKQFGPTEDLSRYPRPRSLDLALCRSAGVDLVFYPAVDTVYPAGHATVVDLLALTGTLCGASRPGHFRGVMTVVTKLFNIVGPTRAYFGLKDAQQCRVIEKMVLDLDVPVRLVMCPTVRESDGLALSSRNVYLTPEERTQAPLLYRALDTARRAVRQGERDGATLVDGVRRVLRQAPAGKVDYVSLVRWADLEPASLIDQPCLLALAVKFGGCRLIDNVRLDPGRKGRSVTPGSARRPVRN